MYDFMLLQSWLTELTNPLIPAGEMLTVTGAFEATADKGATIGCWMKFAGIVCRVIEVPLGMDINRGAGLVWIIIGGLAGGIIGNVLLAVTWGGMRVGVDICLLWPVKT